MYAQPHVTPMNDTNDAEHVTDDLDGRPRVPRVRRPSYTDPTAGLDVDQDLFSLSLTHFRWMGHPAMWRHYFVMTVLLLSLVGAGWGAWKLAQWLVTVL